MVWSPRPILSTSWPQAETWGIYNGGFKGEIPICMGIPNRYSGSLGYQREQLLLGGTYLVIFFVVLN